MEGQQSRRHVRRLVLGLVIGLAFTVNAIGQERQPEARVLLNTDRYVVGSKWNLDILVDSPNPLTVRVNVSRWPDSVSVLDGPYIRETTWEKVPGTLTRATRATFTLRTLKAGIDELGPFDVQVGKASITVPAVPVYFLAADEANRRYPVELAWKVPEGPLYEGQAIPMVLMAENLDNLTQPQDPGLTAPAGSLWERAVGLGEIEINSIGEDRLMNIPWGAWMAIPTKPGTLTIPAFRGTVYGLTRSVPALVLPIEPLPADVASSHAVGVFSYTTDAKSGTGPSAGQLVVTQELTGRGNFPYLVLPDITVDGLSLVSRQEGTHYRAASGGYEGSLIVTWKFATDRTQSVVVNLPGFVAFQPLAARIDRWESRLVRTTVSLPSDLPTAVPAPVRRPLTWNQVVQSRPWLFQSPFWFGVSLLPGIFVWGLTWVRRPSAASLATLIWLTSLAGIPSAPAGFETALKASGNQAADLWLSLASTHPTEPGLWYNAGLACRDADRVAEAVQSFRRALLLGFQGPEAAQELTALESKELLSDQFQPWSGPPVEWLLVALSLVVNATFVLWAVQRWTRSNRWMPPLAVVGFAAIVLGVTVVAADQSRHNADAVVGTTDCAIRKVPGDLAENWMTLKAGTVVKVLGNADRWDLVQTGYGLEGWVDGKRLLPLEGR